MVHDWYTLILVQSLQIHEIENVASHKFPRTPKNNYSLSACLVKTPISWIFVYMYLLLVKSGTREPMPKVWAFPLELTFIQSWFGLVLTIDSHRFLVFTCISKGWTPSPYIFILMENAIGKNLNQAWRCELLLEI